MSSTSAWWRSHWNFYVNAVICSSVDESHWIAGECPRRKKKKTRSDSKHLELSNSSVWWDPSVSTISTFIRWITIVKWPLPISPLRHSSKYYRLQSMPWIRSWWCVADWLGIGSLVCSRVVSIVSEIVSRILSENTIHVTSVITVISVFSIDCLGFFSFGRNQFWNK